MAPFQRSEDQYTVVVDLAPNLMRSEYRSEYRLTDYWFCLQRFIHKQWVMNCFFSQKFHSISFASSISFLVFHYSLLTHDLS